MSSACSINEILDINKRKEYTLTSTFLLQSVLTDRNLSAQAVKVWQLLFNKAKYNSEYKVKLSYSSISQLLGRSVRSISRYIKELTSRGYLVLINNFKSNGGQLANTLFIRVPKELIKNAENTNDRKKNVSKENSFNSSKKDTVKPTQNVIENNIPHDKNDVEDTDKNVIQKNINNDLKKNNNNNDVVVNICNESNNPNLYSLPNEKMQESILNYEKEIKFLEERNLSNKEIVTTNYEKMASGKLSREDHLLLLEETGKFDSQIFISEHRINYLKRLIEKEKAAKKVVDELAADNNLIQNKPGGKCIPEFTFKRLVKILDSYGYESDKLNVLINEIVFEIRFGSLVKSQDKKDPLDIEMAVNIALKLVREGRWSTPSMLKKSKLLNP